MDAVACSGYAIKNADHCFKRLNLHSYERFLALEMEPDDYWELPNNFYPLDDPTQEEPIPPNASEAYLEMVRRYKDLCEEFHAKTGLKLRVDYVDDVSYNCDQDDSLPYGVVWFVSGVTDFTPAGRRAFDEGWIFHAHWLAF